MCVSWSKIVLVPFFVILGTLWTPFEAAQASISCRAIVQANKSLIEVLPNKPPKSVRRAFAPENLNLAPTRRFERQLKTLFEVLATSTDGEKVAKALVKNGSRDTLYQLDALIRVYRDTEFSNSETRFELNKSKKQINELSRILGDTTDARRHVRAARKALAPKDILDQLKSERAKTHATLTKFLKSSDWLEGKPGLLKHLARAVDELSAQSTRKDRRHAFKYILTSVEELAAETRVFEKTRIAYRPKDFEKGPHGTRKRWRRALSTIAAFGNFFYLDPSPSMIRSLQHVSFDETRPYFQKFLERIGQDPAVPNPASINRTEFLILLDHVWRLGAAKDLIQAQLAFRDAARKARGLSKEEANEFAEQLVRQQPKYEDPYQTALDVFNEVLSTRLLHHLAAQVRSGI